MPTALQEGSRSFLGRTASSRVSGGRRAASALQLRPLRCSEVQLAVTRLRSSSISQKARWQIARRATHRTTPPHDARHARERCDEHRGPTHGICRECYQAEMEEMLLEHNPGMCRGDAFELVQEWPP